jgi:endogenous inhibitor of DNA gyrase (YacG/DUF329 family)
MSRKTQVKCPTCGKLVEWSEKNPYRPFCSERCKLIDLGAWADGSHRIPGNTPEDFTESGNGDKEHED